MDRKMIYPGQIPLETDLLDTNRFALIGLGKLAAAVLGTTTLVNGLACTPTAPASMQVQVAAGEIYSLQNLDNTAYSSLAADTTHSLLKQGLLMDAVNLTCPAPATSGQSVNYLVQAIYQDIDAQPLTLPYYNASNPTQAYSGPAGSGTAQNTIRKGVCAVNVKAGIAATTGTQQTPAADSGYIGLFVVTVAYGQSTITSGNITTASGAPILSETLIQKISQSTADARYMLASTVVGDLMPIQALPYPTIATASNTLIGVSGNVVADQGGSVTVPAGTLISLGKEVTAGQTGVLGTYTTASWTSPNLAANSTYFLRAQVISGALTFYVQKGTDADAIPASMKGAVNGASGGGFDSTQLDILVAKVVTGAAGSSPAITLLANAALLKLRSYTSDAPYARTTNPYTFVGKRVTDLVLNWARTPNVHQASFRYVVDGAVSNPEDMCTIYSGSGTDRSGTVTARVDRYVYAPIFTWDTNLSTNTVVTVWLHSDFIIFA